MDEIIIGIAIVLSLVISYSSTEMVKRVVGLMILACVMVIMMVAMLGIIMPESQIYRAVRPLGINPDGRLVAAAVVVLIVLLIRMVRMRMQGTPGTAAERPGTDSW